jgi:polyhydroxybutyrate depolymerase
MTMQKQLLVVLGILVLAVLLGASSSIATKLISSKRAAHAAQPRTDADASLQVGNLTRLYDLHVPSSYNREAPIPLVIAFHGAGGDGKAMARMTGLSQLAEQERFIVVYPDAIGQHWDARRRSQPETHNDIGFISALIDQVAQNYNLDRRRIYTTGFSNGGMFAHRAACELSEKIAASAAVAATMPENLSLTCKPAQPISMLMIHGTDDPVVPYGPPPGIALLSMADTVKYWSTHNGCVPEPIKELLPGTSQVSLETYPQCANETTVKLYTIAGGQHVWEIPLPEAPNTPDKPSSAMAVSTIVWDFFKQHPAQQN